MRYRIQSLAGNASENWKSNGIGYTILDVPTDDLMEEIRQLVRRRTGRTPREVYVTGDLYVPGSGISEIHFTGMAEHISTADDWSFWLVPRDDAYDMTEAEHRLVRRFLWAMRAVEVMP